MSKRTFARNVCKGSDSLIRCSTENPLIRSDAEKEIEG